MARGAASSHPGVVGDGPTDEAQTRLLSEAAARLRREKADSAEEGSGFLPPGAALLHGRRHWSVSVFRRVLSDVLTLEVSASAAETRTPFKRVRSVSLLRVCLLFRVFPVNSPMAPANVVPAGIPIQIRTDAIEAFASLTLSTTPPGDPEDSKFLKVTFAAAGFLLDSPVYVHPYFGLPDRTNRESGPPPAPASAVSDVSVVFSPPLDEVPEGVLFLEVRLRDCRAASTANARSGASGGSCAPEARRIASLLTGKGALEKEPQPAWLKEEARRQQLLLTTPREVRVRAPVSAARLLGQRLSVSWIPASSLERAAADDALQHVKNVAAAASVAESSLAASQHAPEMPSLVNAAFNAWLAGLKPWRRLQAAERQSFFPYSRVFTCDFQTHAPLDGAVGPSEPRRRNLQAELLAAKAASAGEEAARVASLRGRVAIGYVWTNPHEASVSLLARACNNGALLGDRLRLKVGEKGDRQFALEVFCFSFPLSVPVCRGWSWLFAVRRKLL